MSEYGREHYCRTCGRHASHHTDKGECPSGSTRLCPSGATRFRPYGDRWTLAHVREEFGGKPTSSKCTCAGGPA